MNTKLLGLLGVLAMTSAYAAPVAAKKQVSAHLVKKTPESKTVAKADTKVATPAKEEKKTEAKVAEAPASEGSPDAGTPVKGGGKKTPAPKK